MWRVHHVQCPDPDGRVIYRIERVGIVEKNVGECEEAQVPLKVNAIQDIQEADSISDGLRNLRVIVEEVRGKCTSGMQVGDHFILRSGRLYIPPDRHFCLYALHAALPLLPAKQRPLPEDDWLNRDNHIICPDPAGNVVLRIEAYP
ncbi:MAG: TIGR04076 family protein [Anaerolineales bacterium]|nr:TIGR04076 family protein [Anaerolineales bacterium]